MLFGQASEEKLPDRKEKQDRQHPGQQIPQPGAVDDPSEFHVRLAEVVGELGVDPGRDKALLAFAGRFFQFAFEIVRTHVHLFDLLVLQELFKLAVRKDLDWTLYQPTL